MTRARILADHSESAAAFQIHCFSVEVPTDPLTVWTVQETALRAAVHRSTSVGGSAFRHRERSLSKIASMMLTSVAA